MAVAIWAYARLLRVNALSLFATSGDQPLGYFCTALCGIHHRRPGIGPVAAGKTPHGNPLASFLTAIANTPRALGK